MRTLLNVVDIINELIIQRLLFSDFSVIYFLTNLMCVSNGLHNILITSYIKLNYIHIIKHSSYSSMSEENLMGLSMSVCRVSHNNRTKGSVLAAKQCTRMGLGKIHERPT
jgi:hypothetical protein